MLDACRQVAAAPLLLTTLYAVLLILVAARHRDMRRETERRRAVELALFENAQRLDTTLDHMDQGLMMVDKAGIVVVCNRRVRDLLDFPQHLPILGHLFDNLVRYQWEHFEFASTDITLMSFVRAGGIHRSPPVYERQRPDGRTLEIRTTRLEDGGYVRTYMDITARRVAEGALRLEAATDDLTGLANRLTFRRHLQAAVDLHATGGGAFALLYLDLDRFKDVNDQFGHHAGDALLATVAERLRNQARSDDTIARIGGDEFAMLVTDVGPTFSAKALAERLIWAVSEPYLLDGRPVEVGVSIGVALASEECCSAEILIQRADLALYHAKREGRSRYHCHGTPDDEHGAHLLFG